MGDIALRGNRLTAAKGGRIGLRHGGKPWGTGPKPGTEEYWMQQLNKPRKGKLLGGALRTAAKKIKKHRDTKKGKFPETESLTHQVGPYVGDVGSEGKKRKARPPWRTWDRKPKWKPPIGKWPPPKRKSKPPIGKFPPEKGKWQEAAEGGRIGLKEGGNGKWMQKVSASIKRRGTKGKCTPITKPGCTGRAKALAKTFKKIAKRRKAA